MPASQDTVVTTVSASLEQYSRMQSYNINNYVKCGIETMYNEKSAEGTSYLLKTINRPTKTVRPFDNSLLF
jgi:hypothetical protein